MPNLIKKRYQFLKLNKKEINIVWFKRDLRVTDLRTFIYGTATGGLFMNPCRIAKQFKYRFGQTLYLSAASRFCF